MLASSGTVTLRSASREGANQRGDVVLGTHTPQVLGRGGWLDVRPDLTVDGHPGVYAVGDVANIPSGDEDARKRLVLSEQPELVHPRDRGCA